MRRLTTLVLVTAALPAIGGTAAEAQGQRSELCVPGIADTYRFSVPAFTQHEFRVYAEVNNPGIFFLIFDPDSNVRGSASSNSRSLYSSNGLIRGRHQISVSCIRRTRYHLVHVRGNEIRLAAPTYIPFLTGADAADKLSGALASDIVLERQMRAYASALEAAGY